MARRENRALYVCTMRNRDRGFCTTCSRIPTNCTTWSTTLLTRRTYMNWTSSCVNWMTRVGDSWSLDWTAPVEDEERLDKYRAFYTVQDYLAWAKSHPSLTPGIP